MLHFTARRGNFLSEEEEVHQDMLAALLQCWVTTSCTLQGFEEER